MNKQLILGSGSPRRAEILSMAGFEFEIRTADVDEIIAEGITNEGAAEYLACLKASAFLNGLGKHELVLTADTVVILEDKILGKPIDAKDAFEMLRQLSGKTHKVITGVCLITTNYEHSFSDMTEVTFSEFTDDMIHYYISKHQPFDKAGAYGVQEFLGMVGVEKMNGSFYNVMGLPIHKVFQALNELNEVSPGVV